MIKRKRLLKKIVKSPVLFVDHLVGHGVDLFRAVCKRDLEGIVAKAAEELYQPEKTTWVKIKNPNYSQAAGRKDFFDVRRKTCRSIWQNPALAWRESRMKTDAALQRVDSMCFVSFGNARELDLPTSAVQDSMCFR